MSKPLQLTDTQLMLLSSAAQREDRLITLPDRLKGGAAKAVAAKLLSGSLIEEVIVARDDPHWRQDEEDQPIGLRITAAGLQAIGIEEDDGTSGSPAIDGEEATPVAAEETAEPSAKRPLREGTKQALVLSLLSRPEGATIDDLLSATGWLPHTTRAALTGLRQKGYAITRIKDKGGESVYRIAPAGELESKQAAPEPAEV